MRPAPRSPRKKQWTRTRRGLPRRPRHCARAESSPFRPRPAYGLAGDAHQRGRRPNIHGQGEAKFNPLITHVASLDAAREQGVFPAEALHLAKRFWPGPLTLVVPLAPGATICAAARAGRQTIALRVPIHPVALTLISAVGRPLSAPSANRSGRVSPVTAAHVAQDLAARSTSSSMAGAARWGSNRRSSPISKGRRSCCGQAGSQGRHRGRARPRACRFRWHTTLHSPGMLQSHYAPRAKLRLDATELEEGEAGLDFGGFLARTRMCWISRPAEDPRKRRRTSSAFCAISTRLACPASRLRPFLGTVWARRLMID